jgi:hypothetical protein
LLRLKTKGGRPTYKTLRQIRRGLREERDRVNDALDSVSEMIERRLK